MVILPFLMWRDAYDALAEDLLAGHYSYELFVGCMLLLTADIFIPIPSSAVSVTTGMFLGAPAAFAAVLAGLTLGSFIGYGFGYYFRRHHFERWHEDVEYRGLSEQFSKFGPIVLLACRGLPLLAEMSVMVAGFHRYALYKFAGITFLGNCILAGIYSFLGDNATNLTSVYFVAAAFVLIPLVTFSLRTWWVGRIQRGDLDTAR